MPANVLGMDTQMGVDCANFFGSQADALTQISANLKTKLNGFDWFGPDADAARTTQFTDVETQLKNAAIKLNDMKAKLLAQAKEQSDASAK
ncbi:MAG TPA: hypothetical protein VFC00_16980 [Micromonosporaceae bacterium]|nr:hypothetical protein [Micromonosporaceae bacterium]